MLRTFKLVSQVVLVVKNLHFNTEDVRDGRVRFLDWEDSLEESTATHFSILAWRITWTKEPCRSIELHRVGHD